MTTSRRAGPVLILATIASIGCCPAQASTPLLVCKRGTGYGYLAQLAVFSGYRWIACLVGDQDLQIEQIEINHGNCEVFDAEVVGRTYARGETIVIYHPCLDAVSVAITANGRTSEMRLN